MVSKNPSFPLVNLSLGILFYSDIVLHYFQDDALDEEDPKFDKEVVSSLIKTIIEEHIGNREYLEEMTTNWTNAILEKCVVALTKLQKPFKYIGKYSQTWS